MLIFSFIPFRTSKNKLNFQPNDKVCCTKNGYVTDHEKKKEEVTSCDTPRAEQDSAQSSHDNAGNQTQNEQAKEKKEKKERLCNGEIFFIKDVLMIYLAIYMFSFNNPQIMA